ncbi:hypothetical protein Sliba_80300 [Streptomyces nigrescens]|uniref:Uncharacterized protein n=1 Tax=Streptomyces nigrescens TaxID=1920 RepID=A0A640TVA0_STRNI|nr:hypothetical protein Sliba_80300 [Streptomyces libani subsp. libani]GGW08706.1 hypothetical protein GCM10010500_80060 [Streptomyces libani subsp. libani]
MVIGLAPGQEHGQREEQANRAETVVKRPAEDRATYDLSSRSAEGHPAQIRETLDSAPRPY